MSIYLDNAATTPLHSEVFGAMIPYLTEHFGNPSANNIYGRKVKDAIEESRSTIAGLLNVHSNEIIFTPGGTQANHIAVTAAVAIHGIDHVITSPFEHDGILQTLRSLQKNHNTRISFLRHDKNGRLNLNHLEYLLRTNTRNLISVTHANNVTGLINPIAEIAELSRRYGATFHSDTVQTIGNNKLDVEKSGIDFVSASAHKFHGPKGAGFLFSRKGRRIFNIINEQDTAGTENAAAIIGLAKALEIAYLHAEGTNNFLHALKQRMISGLQEQLPGIRINSAPHESHPKILSISFPDSAEKSFSSYLDSINIAVSGHSAYYKPNTVELLKALGISADMETIRFSFGIKNTPAEIDSVVESLVALYQIIAA